MCKYDANNANMKYNQLDSRPPVEPEPDPASTISTEEPEVVLKSIVSFERKKLDLSIYTFDETPMEQFIEDTILDESPSLNNCKSLFDHVRCFFVLDEDALPYDDNDWMISCMQNLKRTNLKKHKLILKKTKSKLERLNVKLMKKLISSKSLLKRTH